MATQEEINGIFPAMMDNFQADKATDTSATIQFNLTGDNGGMYWVKIDDGAASHGEGDVNADMTIKAAADDFYSVVTGNMNPMQAYMMGKIKADNVQLAMKMMQIFKMG